MMKEGRKEVLQLKAGLFQATKTGLLVSGQATHGAGREKRKVPLKEGLERTIGYSKGAHVNSFVPALLLSPLRRQHQ
jgi:hypothetical protein